MLLKVYVKIIAQLDLSAEPAFDLRHLNGPRYDIADQTAVSMTAKAQPAQDQPMLDATSVVKLVTCKLHANTVKLSHVMTVVEVVTNLNYVFITTGIRY